MTYGMAYGMAGMAEWYMKQSSTKGYEDELQAHFNSII